MPALFGRARCPVTAALSDTPYLSGPHPRFCFGFIRGWIRSKSTSTDHDDYEDFYHYTGGRWLWVEKTRLKERYKRFNVSELKRLAAESVGAEKCVGISKLAEGGFNKVFRLVMDNDFIVIARIPNPNARPGFKATASEVATMHFARDILDIPVPRVLTWSGKADNTVNSEYILMEEAVGTQLGEIWQNLKLRDKLKIVDDIVAIENKLLSLSFTRYSNLYFKKDAFSGCQNAEVIGEVPQAVSQSVEDQFVIGPMIGRDFRHRERASMKLDRGPWTTPADYLKAIALREIAWIESHATERPSTGLFPTSEAQRSGDAHINLYRKFLDIAEHLLPRGEPSRPSLWHWDIHAANLFVHDGRISSLIDWQDTWVGPLFLQARHPRLVDYNGELMLELPEHYETVKDGDEKERIRTQVEKSIILWAYENDTKSTNPILQDILHIYQGRTRRETVNFASNTWDKDIIPFRQCLIRIARHWDEINADLPCPVSFTEEDIKAHLKDGEGWNEIADFWDSLQDFVHRDGWNSNEHYEQAFEIFAQLREEGLKSRTGEDREEHTLGSEEAGIGSHHASSCFAAQNVSASCNKYAGLGGRMPEMA